jgi:simple sugar transport system ATP-binding protein
MALHKIELKGISISFPGVKALSDVDFEIQSGEVRAVVGANGAGQSTLMKVLSGAYSHYEGDIFFDGELVRMTSPIDAKNLGIEMVYQEVDTALFPSLSVAENIMFNRLVNGMNAQALVKWPEINREAKKVIHDLNLNINPKALVSGLSLAQKQMVLIARAVQEECGFLILDEPTAPLSTTEVEELFKLVRHLSYEKKVGVIFISHRLPELFEICKTITVMRNGEMVVKKQEISSELTINEIVSNMLGKSFDEIFPRKCTNTGEMLFEAEQLCDGTGKVNEVDLHLREGEIVGICGLVGAGKTELSKLLFGASRCHHGKIRIRGKSITLKNTTTATNSRIALVPEERRKEGVIVTQDVVSNLSIACINRFVKFLSFVMKPAEVKNAEKFISDLGILTPSPFQKVKYLSGGNQQKVAIGKWLAADADVYIMDEPTKGIDVGAKREIFDLIYALAAEKKGVLYISSEVSEILAVTERVYVMYDGKIQKELITSETSEQEIMFYSTGGTQDASAI